MIEELEDKHALRILLVLLERGRVKSLTELAELLNVKSLTAPSKRVWHLKELGLVDVKMSERPPQTMEITLTPLGREVAEHVKAIDELLRKRGGVS